MVASLLVTVILSFVIIISGTSQLPGAAELIDTPNDLPLVPGYCALFGIRHKEAAVLMLPGLAMWFYVFIFSFSRQAFAMGLSKLIPSVFARTYGNSRVPHIAIIIGSITGYAIILIAWFLGHDNFFVASEIIYAIAELMSFSVFVAVFISFIIFRMRYSNLTRVFNNPFGIPSAIYGICVYLISFIGGAFFFYITDSFLTIGLYAAYCGLSVIYYFSYARNRQSFSKDERDILFSVYVIKGSAQ
jgi:ethanolamine permease